MSYKFKARGRFIFKASGEASAVHLINFKNVHATEIDANYFPEIWKILTDEIVAIPAHYYIILDSEENNSWCAVYNNGDILCAFTEEMKDKLTK